MSVKFDNFTGVWVTSDSQGRVNLKLPVAQAERVAQALREACNDFDLSRPVQNQSWLWELATRINEEIEREARRMQRVRGV